MNYKDLFERYKKGLASEEEKVIVEKEMEKYEAIEDFVAESIDEKFDQDSNTQIFDIQKEETNKLKKSVNNKLKKVVLISVLSVIALYILIFQIFSGIVDKVYYDPSASSQSETTKYTSSDLYYDMQAYVSLNMPGYSINTFTSEENKGFGKYEVSYSLEDLFTKDAQRYFVNITRGKLLLSTLDGIFSNESLFGIWKGFDIIQNSFPNDNSENANVISEDYIKHRNEKTIQYLEEVNPLSYISMSVVFDEDITMEEFYNMKNEHPDLKFKWVGVRTVEPGTSWKRNQSMNLVAMHLVGFNPNYNDEASSCRYPDLEKYPLFYLNDFRNYSELDGLDYPDKIAAGYGIHFKSRLEYLKNREDYVDMFDYNSYKTDFYADSLKYIDEHGVKTYGVLIYANAKDFLENLDDIPYTSIYINKVLPTKPDIYWE